MFDRAVSLFFLSIVMFVSAPVAAEDDYLEALEMEAKKLAPADDAPVSGPGAGQRMVADRSRFESELGKHKGTYSLYRRLPEKDKAEIFKAYREGASIARIRRMVIDRRMHR